MLEEPPVLKLCRSIARPTARQIQAFEGVPTGFVCDALGGQGALDRSIRPLVARADAVHVVGPAVVADNGPADLLATLGGLHLIQPGDVLVAAVHGHQGCAAVGDLVCGMLKNRGARALVTDGVVRDYAGLMQVDLPLWCTGLSPNSPFAKGPGTAGFGAQIGGRQVNSGDLVVADADGVVTVPFARIDEIIAQLDAIREAEAEMDAKVADGLGNLPVVEDLLSSGGAVWD
ncbi:RraA family protein [Litorivicinus lipolyticus]|uniref:Putative 4-hydroxy-4-methyl-2-oxoglutarate aldolase n=1 Tax=Litorivicinus lipolyticus TaxID=418701 RepID=A0A5Q2QC11_9GAMM|nr:RraA family protein [Litorivicinus lipolyticus]QGG79527.1 RraA family protein [Litorivicinus lipolyticus]